MLNQFIGTFYKIMRDLAKEFMNLSIKTIETINLG